MWIWFNITMVEGTAIMHVNLVIILEMCNKSWDITRNRALRSGIRAIVWTESTMLLMLKLAVVWEDIITTQTLVCTWEFQWFSNFLQSQTPYISKIITACWATVEHSNLAVWTQRVTIWTLQIKNSDKKESLENLQNTCAYVCQKRIISNVKRKWTRLFVPSFNRLNWHSNLVYQRKVSQFIE